MIKLVSFTKILLLIVVSGVGKFDEIRFFKKKVGWNSINKGIIMKK